MPGDRAALPASVEVSIPNHGSGKDSVRHVVAVAISRLLQAVPGRVKTDLEIVEGLLAEAALRTEDWGDIREEVNRAWGQACPLLHENDCDEAARVVEGVTRPEEADRP